MDKENSLWARLSEKLKNPKIARIVLIAGLAGIALIFLSTLLGGKGEKNENPPRQDTDEAYRDGIAASLKEMVAAITGDGGAQVLVTLESGTQYVYANETKQNIDITEDNQGESRIRTQQKDSNEQKHIIIDSPDGGKTALLVTELAPRIKGVVVVCKGGFDEGVQSRVTDAVTTALDITSKRVCVTGVQ